jgi:amino acid transporter
MLVILAPLTALNIRGVRQANRFNAVMTIAKLLPLALLVFAGAFVVHGANLVWQSAPSARAIGRSSVFLIFAFLGVETALVPSGEVKDPARTVPRAVFLAIGSIAVLYIAVQIVTQGVLGASLATSKTPVADAGGAAFGPWGRTLILVGSTVSMFGYVSGMTLAVPRMLYAFARDGFLPRSVAAVHPRFRTPYRAIVIQAVLVVLLAASRSFEWLAYVANGAVLLVYATCCLATLALRRRDVRAGGVPFRLPAAAIVPWLALAVIIALLATLQQNEWLAVLSLVAVAAFVFVIARSRRTPAITEPVGD